MNKISLSHTAAGWFATFHGDQNVIGLFGTDTIPTAYTAHASAAVVLDHIRALNPGCEVSLAV